MGHCMRHDTLDFCIVSMYSSWPQPAQTRHRARGVHAKCGMSVCRPAPHNQPLTPSCTCCCCSAGANRALSYQALRVANATFVVSLDEMRAVLYSAASMAALPSYRSLPSMAPFMQQFPMQVRNLDRGHGDMHPRCLPRMICKS
jgi:hypothetical protein